MTQLQRSQVTFFGHFERKNRGVMEMMASILQVCLEGTKKTHVMYRANISSDSLKAYLDLLINCGMLEKSGSYRTTIKGRIYLEHFRGILILLGKDDSNDSSTSRSF